MKEKINKIPKKETPQDIVNEIKQNIKSTRDQHLNEIKDLLTGENNFGKNTENMKLDEATIKDVMMNNMKYGEEKATELIEKAKSDLGAKTEKTDISNIDKWDEEISQSKLKKMGFGI